MTQRGRFCRMVADRTGRSEILVQPYQYALRWPVAAVPKGRRVSAPPSAVYSAAAGPHRPLIHTHLPDRSGLPRGQFQDSGMNTWLT